MNAINDTMSYAIDRLQQEYQRYRPAKLTLEQFTYLVQMFPSLLVSMSDGVLDKEEWDAVLRAAENLGKNLAASPDEVESLSDVYKTEFRYLIDNSERWRKKFINALNDFLKEDPTAKDLVLESMYLFANATDGISSAEQKLIDELSSRLDLNN
ncbi:MULTISPECIES: tellurite resistance TerB family protein [Imperialibacter]|uniref:Tellurite resistance TerB family protein n=1 Tax=Imperialibacter roseus TaxID=1324217 RepID=A0ABZ0ILA3_9BACT|nr:MULTISPECIES: tellurite resistance TerB family protein [Imperialibacter]WOK05807.1 tellurite resistance TerB family protein [Imperialibacter roseus]CAD5273956.1 conserved hypothetical protein [Imperialibacter sp. 75]CAD5287593.1 conserved hypothetical protein [Imperialibacter sp. 89]VVT35533.1 conserved hypothetical protein [Imperialibacter sp. EC-SDR9]|tara:strand:+ start:7251 stop:7712 length:462 start_codon:yes stop_codon:yes gene_type:complete